MVCINNLFNQEWHLYNFLWIPINITWKHECRTVWVNSRLMTTDDLLFRVLNLWCRVDNKSMPCRRSAHAAPVNNNDRACRRYCYATVSALRILMTRLPSSCTSVWALNNSHTGTSGQQGSSFFVLGRKIKQFAFLALKSWHKLNTEPTEQCTVHSLWWTPRHQQSHVFTSCSSCYCLEPLLKVRPAMLLTNLIAIKAYLPNAYSWVFYKFHIAAQLRLIILF